jgi:hypothetical protein
LSKENVTLILLGFDNFCFSICHIFIVFLTSTLVFEISVYSVLTDWVLILLFVWVVLFFVPLFSPIHLNSMSCFATEHFVFNSLRNRFRLDTPLASSKRCVLASIVSHRLGFWITMMSSYDYIYSVLLKITHYTNPKTNWDLVSRLLTGLSEQTWIQILIH